MQNSTQPSDLAPLWARARAMFARASAAMGGAAGIAAIAVLTQAMRKEIIGWVGRLEHLVRKLLFAEAARLPRERNACFQAQTFPARFTANDAVAAASPARRVSRIDLSRPETWPARFSLAIPSDPLACPEARVPRIRALWGPDPPPPTPPQRPPKREETALHLARRFEALRRVLDNPAPHAARLARIIRRLVFRFREAPRLYAWATAHVGFVDRADPSFIADCFIAADNGLTAFDSS